MAGTVIDAVIDLTEPQRQSPFAIVMIGVRIVRSLGIVQLIVAIAVLARWAADGRLLIAIMAVGLVFLAVSVLSWWRYTFRLADGELVVTRGVVRIDRLTVPVGRIQSISVEQELLHRLTGLVKVVVDTAGSSQAEFTIDAVGLPVADELRRRVGSDTPSARSGTGVVELVDHTERAERTERIVFQHDPRRLVLTALTMSPWAGLALLVPLLAVSQEALEPVTDRLSEAAPDVRVDALGWWSVSAIVIAAVVFVVVLNLGRVLLTDWQLALRADPTTLRRTSGLLSRTSTSSTRDRVQVVTSRQNPLQRRVGLRDLHLSNAGSGDLRFGGCRDDEAGATAGLVGLTPVGELAPNRRVHPALVWLRVRNTSVVAAVVAAAAWPFVGWWSLAALVVVAPVWWATNRHVHTHRWSLGPEVVTSTRVVSSSTQQLLVRKTNAVRVTQTLFERRRGLGRVNIATAAGTVTIGMIPIDEAYAVRDTVLYGVETDRRSWM